MQAFGKSSVNADPDGNNISVTMNMRFPGQYEDQESGLYQNYFRDYDPEIGRYVESDPIGLRGVNTYVYVTNMPIRSVDLLGLQNTYPNEICVIDSNGRSHCFPVPVPPPKPIQSPSQVCDNMDPCDTGDCQICCTQFKADEDYRFNKFMGSKDDCSATVPIGSQVGGPGCMVPHLIHDESLKRLNLRRLKKCLSTCS